MIAADMK